MANQRPPENGEPDDAQDKAGTAFGIDGSDDIDSRGGSARGGDDLDALLDQFGGSEAYRVQLERIDPVDGAAYLGTLPLNSELVQLVEQRYGGGRYGGKVVDNKSKYVRRMPQFRIAGEPRDPRAAIIVAPAAAANDTSSIIQAIAAGFQSFRESLADAIRQAAQAPQPVAPAVDPLAMVAQVAQLLQTIQPKQQPAADLVGTMRDLLELQNELRGERTEGGGGIADVMREYVPIVRDALANNHEPAAPVKQPEPKQVHAPQTAVAEWLRPFMQYRQMLLTFADQKKDPALYAGLIADNISDHQATLIAQAQAAGTMELDLFDAVPQLNQSDDRRRFAGALLDNLRAELFGQPKMRRAKKRAKKPAAKVAGAAT